MPAVSISITILRLPYVDSGPGPIMKKFKLYSGLLFFLYTYESVNANFDDMVCTWNAGHVICMISSTSHGKPWTSEKCLSQ